MPWSDYPLTTLTLPQGAGSGTPREVFNVVPIPAALVTYYLTPPLAPASFTAPETIAWVNQYFDAAGDYQYDAMVTDSSATPKTSIVQGAVVGGVVTESHRFALNPGATLGGGRFEYFNERSILIMVDPADGTTVLSTRHPTDTFDVFSCNILGTLGWGDGTALTDAYLTRIPGAGGDMELAPYLQIRGFFALTDPLLQMLQDGDAGFRWQVNADGSMYSGDGTGDPPWRYVPSNEAVTNIAPAGTQNINSTAFTSVTGVSTSLTKRYAGTRVKVTIIGQGFVSAVDNIILAALVNGVDNQVDVFRYNAINTHEKFGGFTVITGLAAGTYTVQARLKVATGTTTWTTGASVAGWSISAEEIA